MMQKISIERSLALFMETNRRIKVGFAFAWQYVHEELHCCGGHSSLHHEVSSVKTENSIQIVRVQNQRVYIETAVFVIEYGYDKGGRLVVVDDASDQVCCFISEKQRIQDVNLIIE